MRISFKEKPSRFFGKLHKCEPQEPVMFHKKCTLKKDFAGQQHLNPRVISN